MIRCRILLALRVALWVSLPVAIFLVISARVDGVGPFLVPGGLLALLFLARHIPLPRAWDDKHPPRFGGCMACETWAAVTGVEVVPPLRDLEELEADGPPTRAFRDPSH